MGGLLLVGGLGPGAQTLKSSTVPIVSIHFRSLLLKIKDNKKTNQCRHLGSSGLVLGDAQSEPFGVELRTVVVRVQHDQMQPGGRRLTRGQHGFGTATNSKVTYHWAVRT